MRAGMPAHQSGTRGCLLSGRRGLLTKDALNHIIAEKLLNLRNIFILLLLATMATACAKQGMPSGGPKDSEPPKVLAMKPANASTNFVAKEFYIQFDEYVTVKDAENNILVSPPMAHKPEYRSKGKGLLVRLNDTLRENATYLFQFKGAVVDFNEGNALPSLEYVFSTGSQLDSMMLEGSVVDALSLLPKEQVVSVLLFNNAPMAWNVANDTAGTSTATQPAYATRCDKEGNFQFNYIRPGDYHVVALIDENKDLQVGENEPVGFLNGAVNATPMGDSTDLMPTPRLLLFSPKTEKQRIVSADFKSSGKVQIVAKMPFVDPSFNAGNEALVWSRNTKGDTITIWTSRQKCDSLSLIVRDPSGIDDTLRLRWKAKRRSLTTALEEPLLKLNVKSLPFFDSLRLPFSTPLDTAHCRLDSVARIVRLDDSAAAWCDATIDSSSLSAQLPFAFLQGGKYSIDIEAGRFRDIYGNTNDSVHTVFDVTKAEDYGDLHLEVVADSAQGEASYHGPLIIELLNDKGAVLMQRTLHGDGKVHFLHLTAGKYRVRAILDANGNGSWDTGDFFQKRQPEKVVFLEKTIEVRANWEYEEQMNL